MAHTINESSVRHRSDGYIHATDTNNPEAEVRDRLADDINGRVEVKCSTGIIDILTDTDIIEVKCAKNWKHAVGQILIYGADYPDHAKRIHLFDADDFDIELIRTRCAAHGVTVTADV
jgi:hypothetical protein